MGNKVRIDKWLWAVRLYKTRSLATEECGKGRVMIDGMPAKASREIKVGDKVQIRKPPIVRTYEVLDIAEKRMAAKLTEGFVRDITPAEQLEILEMQKHMSWFQRDKGAGRPTKKERRDLDDFFEI
ncbi:MAG: RNA-binding protein [Bacteroidetes bacterium GWF2_42_66]|nr:MAG: RNA-binding protein [Bacteroidetes bacterium GWA2_42_15]OFX97285.1 MAG: RNA-binding protein [Bacteroidetes bacterium GWE2_42_39]OFY39922.1 MAG: RNA-binding protein [Bacteroidetes bacterium GWF2_42_66]HBL78104.1 RNA-binding protein [Prolixibacteraceae bacterium]HCU61196.1 RNA-binding protein [Prolixibacteraceae bacterium]